MDGFSDFSVILSHQSQQQLMPRDSSQASTLQIILKNLKSGSIADQLPSERRHEENQIVSVNKQGNNVQAAKVQDMNKLQLQFLESFPVLGQLMDNWKRQVHEIKLKNMQLRQDQSKIQKQMQALAKENASLKEKVEVLEKKAATDCETILQQVKELEKLTASQK